MMPSSPNRPCSALKATSGLSFASVSRDVAIDIEPGDGKPLGFEGLRAGLARAQRNLALRREAAHEDGDMLGHDVIPIEFGKVSSPNRTKMFHVKHFGTIDGLGKCTRARRGEI